MKRKRGAGAIRMSQEDAEVRGMIAMAARPRTSEGGGDDTSICLLQRAVLKEGRKLEPGGAERKVL